MRTLQFGISLARNIAHMSKLRELTRLADTLELNLLGIQDHPYISRYFDTMSLIAILLISYDCYTYPGTTIRTRPCLTRFKYYLVPVVYSRRSFIQLFPLTSSCKTVLYDLSIFALRQGNVLILMSVSAKPRVSLSLPLNENFCQDAQKEQVKTFVTRT